MISHIILISLRGFVRAALCVCLIWVASDVSSAFAARQRSRHRALKVSDTVCGAESCPGQVVLQFQTCPADFDPLGMSDRLTKLSEEITKKKDKLTLSPIAGGCVFVAKSQTRTPQQVIALFQRLQAEVAHTTLAEKRTRLQEFITRRVEPNFRFKLDVGNLTSGKGFVASNPPWWFLQDFPGTTAVPAWDKYGNGSKDIVVGIVDTGILPNHPNLNVWRAGPFRLNTASGTIDCPSGTYGFDVLATGLGVCSPLDDEGHGTHVAGIVAGTNLSGTPIGVSSQTSVMAFKIADKYGFTCISNAIKALDFAINAKRQLKVQLLVLNNSYSVSVPCPELLTLFRDEIAMANSENILFVASAGQGTHVNSTDNDNDTIPHYPSGFYDLDNVISVTAIDEAGNFLIAKGETANYGKRSVHLAAPGSSIYSTDLPINNYFHSRSGTSMAAPFVSGAAALLLSVPGCLGLPPVKTKELILKGTDRTPALVDKTATNGRLNVFRSIAMCAQ